MGKINRPFVLSIAGFDPSGGAGILADCKTFEQLGCYGLAVQTANTLQDEEEVHDCHWVSLAVIKKQLKILLLKYPIKAVKIGIIENAQVLLEIIKLIKNYTSPIPIILDPVLRASSSFQFQTTQSENVTCEILKEITLITPNQDEFKKLFGENKAIGIRNATANTNLLLKGGHLSIERGTDYLYTKTGESYTFAPIRKDCLPKHGSGCVLSSAITAFLAEGNELAAACEKAKNYTELFLSSTPDLLGYHTHG